MLSRRGYRLVNEKAAVAMLSRRDFRLVKEN